MADCLDDAEFCLPSQFLSDEDFLMDMKGSGFGFGFGFGHGLKAAGGGGGGGLPSVSVSLSGVASGLSSPVDSLLGSLEGESDEEDLLADITRKLARSNLDDGFKFADSKVAPRLLSGSPQSTLCPGWDVLRDAAGEAARIRLSERLYALSRSRAAGDAVYGTRGRQSPVTVPAKTHVSDGGFNFSHQNRLLAHHQLVENQIQQLKQQQAIFKNQQLRAGANWARPTAKPTTSPYPHAQCGGWKPAGNSWPALHQQQNGQGMRAVFLGGPPTEKRECAGTGVFLPRRAGSLPEPRKKPASSTVFLPDKVIRALNLNLENANHQSQLSGCFNGRSIPENDLVWNMKKTSVPAPQGRSTRQPPMPNHEIRLPQEWTY